MKYRLTHWALLLLLVPFSFTNSLSETEQEFCNGGQGIVFSYLAPTNGDFWYICLLGPKVPNQFSNQFDAISPNYQLIASIDYSTSPFQLVFKDLQNPEYQFALQSQPNWLLSDIQWITDDTLAIRTNENDALPYSGDLLLIQIPDSDPVLWEINVEPPTAVGDYPAVFSYNSTLDYYVYSAWGVHSSCLALVRRSDGNIIWQEAIDMSQRPPYSYYPSWSQDGTAFIYVRHSETSYPVFEIVEVDTTGEERQLTTFSGDLENGNLIYNPVWSMDNRSVAFWYAETENFMQLEVGHSLRLQVLDIETGQLRDFPISHANMGTFDLVWSPDSQYIAAVTVDDSAKQALIILDTVTNEVVLSENDVANVKFWFDGIQE